MLSFSFVSVSFVILYFVKPFASQNTPEEPSHKIILNHFPVRAGPSEVRDLRGVYQI